MICMKTAISAIKTLLKNADSAHDLRLDIQLRSRRAQNAGPDLD